MSEEKNNNPSGVYIPSNESNFSSKINQYSNANLKRYISIKPGDTAFRNNVFNFYQKHEKGLTITKNISFVVSAGLMALMLGVIVAASIITGGMV